MKDIPTFTAQIYMAGDIVHAKQVIRKYAREIGLCVTIEKVSFIYSGGEEVGLRVGFINYPRFPESADHIEEKALNLAELLQKELGQESFSIVTSGRTIWSSRRTAPPLDRRVSELVAQIDKALHDIVADTSHVPATCDLAEKAHGFVHELAGILSPIQCAEGR